jgi:SAM-dependent methyltransferase
MTLRDQLAKNPFLECQDNIFYQRDFLQSSPFEEVYLKLRQKENRIYSDNIVKRLPEIDSSHPNKREWDMRKSTLDELIRLLKQDGTKDILELGCGNGWLSYNLSISLDAQICGLDINKMELSQGGRVFNGRENLCFVFADIYGPVFSFRKFETIVLGGVIQYFSNLSDLLSTLFKLLQASGSIYIVDSPLYSSTAEALAAKERSLQHFTSLGIPEMKTRYHHHTFKALTESNIVETVYHPKSIVTIIKRKVFQMPLSIFPILRVKRKI